MDEEGIFLVEDTQLSICEKKRRKSRKRSWEEQPIASSGQISYSSQDTEDFGTSTKKHKKKKTSSETSDASWIIPETPLIDESEINDFVPKKKKKKKKHRHKHGSEDECGSPSTPQKSSKLSPKKASENGGDDAVGDEFCSVPTPKKSRKLSKASENGGDNAVGDEFWSASTSKKSSKLSLKKALENGGDDAVGDDLCSVSTSKKSSKLSPKKALENGGDSAVGDEFCSVATPQKSRKLSLKKASENEGDDAVGDEFRSMSTPQKSSKLSRKEDLENGSVVESNRSSHKKKKRKQKMSCVPDGPAKEKAEATRSSREDQVNLDQSIDTQMDLFASSPLSFSEGPQVGLLPRDDQEGSHCPTAEDSDATQVDLEMEGTSAGDHRQKQPPSPSKLLTSEVDKKSDQSRMGRKLRSSRKQPPSETSSEEEEDAYVLFKEQLENNRKELEEYIPRAKTLSDSAIRQLATRDLSRFREMKKKGVAVRFGVFSQAENDLLTKNVEEFLEESGIETAEKLLFAHRFPEEQAEIKRLKCQYLFCERISRGIARPWRLVYYRARKMFDPQNYNGRYTKKEEKKLLKYHAIYGNNWKKISELMNRSSHSIALKYSQMVEDSKLGPWTKEETSRLLKAVKDIVKAKMKGLENREGKGTLTLLRENLYKNIRWMKVAAQVETRSWRQCKKKWMSILTKRMMGKSRSRGRSNLQFKIDLIERLYDLNVADTNEIDWESIAEVVGNVPPDYLKTRYYQLKSTYVPFWYQKTFPEIIDYLFEETLPVLKETFQKLYRRQRHPQEETSCKKSFQFNDIFRDMLEDELLNAVDNSDGETGEPSQAE